MNNLALVASLTVHHLRQVRKNCDTYAGDTCVFAVSSKDPYLAIVLAGRYLHALVYFRYDYTKVLLNLAQEVGLIVPDGTSSLLR